MGKRRAKKNNQMDMDDGGSAGQGWSAGVGHLGDGDGMATETGGLEGGTNLPNVPRAKKATVRRGIQLRKKAKLDKALARAEKTITKIDKNTKKKDMRKALKGMY
mmetsp:Transcript_12751/g.15399  ORF Transcript_12751/g.15399 Transcript_12751/m.15399 type:complete len:105 (+) Transcript_12751:146-460(+)